MAIDKIQRMLLHVKGFDEHLGGGIPNNHVVLITGNAGTMKSSLAFNVAYHEIKKNNKRALYISLEETYDAIEMHMEHLGYNLKEAGCVHMGYDLKYLKKIKNNEFKKGKGGMVISDLGQVRKELADKELAPNENWFFLTKALIKEAKKELDIDIVILDSMSALHSLSQLENPRVKLFYFFEFLRDLNITSFLITEMSSDGTKMGTFEEEIYLADGIIKLGTSNRHRKVSREISITKMRATNVSTDVFTLQFKKGVFEALYGGQTPLI
jgi:KaiC/GvpD/RAD55 family RecA-like ATPase